MAKSPTSLCMGSLSSPTTSSEVEVDAAGVLRSASFSLSGRSGPFFDWDMGI